MAAVASSTGLRPLLYAAGGGVLAYGAYFGIQQKEIRKYEKEVSDVSKLISKEKEMAQSNARLIVEHEDRISQLDQEENVLRSELLKAQERLAAAQQTVSKLAVEVDSISNSKTSAFSRLTALRNDNLRVQEALTLGEKSLQMAQQKAQHARSLLNPLNHPAFAGKKR